MHHQMCYGMWDDPRHVYNKLQISNAKCCHEKNAKLECGPMPNVMAALPNIGGGLCSHAAKFC